MLITCWSVKGGSGTTVVAAAIAALQATHPPGALLVDLCGDAPAALGLPEPLGPGLSGWLHEPEVPPDALARLEVPVGNRLSVVPCGPPVADAPFPARRVAVLASLLAHDARTVVVDAGVLRPGLAGGSAAAALPLAAAATLSLLVLRPCYLALRRAAAAPIRPSAVVLVSEPGRSLDAGDVVGVLGVPVRSVVDWDPAVARAVDSGSLPGRVPRPLARALRWAAA